MDGQDAWAEKGRREMKRAWGRKTFKLLERARVWLRMAYGDVEKGSLVVTEGIYG